MIGPLPEIGVTDDGGLMVYLKGYANGQIIYLNRYFGTKELRAVAIEFIKAADEYDAKIESARKSK